MKRLHLLGLALLMAAAPVFSQDKAATKPTAPVAAAKPTAATLTAPPAAAAVAKPADAPVALPPTASPKKKHVAATRKPANTCIKLDDPWDNWCDIQKKAQLACSDLPAAKKAAKKAKNGEAPVVPENQRQQCIDNYMRNV